MKLDYREPSVGGGGGDDSETKVFGLLALGVLIFFVLVAIYGLK